MRLRDVHDMFVSRFPTSSPRERLFWALEELVQRFLREKIPCEMWIDGSFVTEKMDPSDVDVLVMIDPDVADNLTEDQRVLVDSANLPEYINGIDSFVDVEYPLGHPLRELPGDDRSWAELYGVEHGEFWLKGFAVLRLWETSVGLRIRS